MSLSAANSAAESVANPTGEHFYSENPESANLFFKLVQKVGRVASESQAIVAVSGVIVSVGLGGAGGFAGFVLGGFPGSITGVVAGILFGAQIGAGLGWGIKYIVIALSQQFLEKKSPV